MAPVPRQEAGSLQRWHAYVEDLALEGQVRQELTGLLNGQVGIVHGNISETERENWGAAAWHIFPHALPEARL